MSDLGTIAALIITVSGGASVSCLVAALIPPPTDPDPLAPLPPVDAPAPLYPPSEDC
ncbi:hypothetical protein [Sphingomonas oleivorans]|uniref:hypothetical protein n=1 Tax=Sphingomonas oleivorans TaxID=1735121 RepID=UPI0013FE01AE|nr:hypothetical protein [Sphingomonas oleivorans]